MKELLKHRVWDIQSHDMMYDTAIIGNTLVISYEQHNGILDLIHYVNMDEKRYKVMPYVNVSDDEGEDVFLGDIVQADVPIGSTQVGMIVFNDGMYFFQTHRILSGVPEAVMIPVGLLDSLIVLGNVYENADILKGGIR